MLRVISQSPRGIRFQDQSYSQEDVFFFARLVETCGITSDQGWREGVRPALATTGRVLGAQRGGESRRARQNIQVELSTATC